MRLAPPPLQLRPSRPEPPPLPDVKVAPRVVPLPIDEGVMEMHKAALKEMALSITRSLQQASYKPPAPPAGFFEPAKPSKGLREAWRSLQAMEREEEDWSEEDDEDEDDESRTLSPRRAAMREKRREESPEAAARKEAAERARLLAEQER